jgi:hypothetical protein
MQTANFLIGTSTIGAKANQLRQAFKSNSPNIPSWGNSPINKSPFAITRDQRSAIVQNAPPSLNRQEALASQSVGRGLAKQQAPRNGQKPLDENSFLDAGGVARKKIPASAWRSQQAAQTAQYGGFSGNFQHFVNFAGNPYVGAAKIGSLVGLGAGLAKGGGLGESEEEMANTSGLGRVGKMIGRGAQGAATGAFLGAAGRAAADGTGITKGARYIRNKFAIQPPVSTKIPTA